MPTDAYLAFLVLGLIMILVDGQILYRSGQRYLAEVDIDNEGMGSMARLITVLFHIVMFGFLALLSVLDFDFGFGGSDTMRALVGNLGVLLLLLALVHAVTIAVISQIHDSRAADEFYTRPTRPAPTANSHVQYEQYDPVVTPVPGQTGRNPRISPTIEEEERPM